MITKFRIHDMSTGLPKRRRVEVITEDGLTKLKVFKFVQSDTLAELDAFVRSHWSVRWYNAVGTSLYTWCLNGQRADLISSIRAELEPLGADVFESRQRR